MCFAKIVEVDRKQNRIVMPADVMENAGFNFQLPIYVAELCVNHFKLTQNGSDPRINLNGRGRHRSVIRGWKSNAAIGKTFHVGIKNRIDETVQEIAIRLGDDGVYLDAIAG